jgi:hypothetical protein
MIAYPRHSRFSHRTHAEATASAALKTRQASLRIVDYDQRRRARINRLARYLIGPSRRKRRAAARPFRLLPLPETLSLILGTRFFITNTRKRIAIPCQRLVI